MANAPAAGLLVVAVSHRHPVVRGPMPPLVTLCHRLGESPRAGVRMGLFLCCDVGLCMLTGVGPQIPCQFPPRWCSPSYRSSSLLERGSLRVMRAPSLRGRRVWCPSLARLRRRARVMMLFAPKRMPSGIITSPK
jgi:hypothetical protein